MMVSNLLGAAFLLVLCASVTTVDGFGRRVRRVKAGKQYAEHEAVHIVVNKVG